MCSATRATLRSRSIALVTARSSTKAPPRLTRGSTPRMRWRRACHSSLTISPTVSSRARTKTKGLAKNRRYWRPGPSPSPMPARLITRWQVEASPLNIVEMLTPPPDNSPAPSDSRASTSAASPGRFVTTSRPSSFSYQRKAGMPSLVPCSNPA